MSTQFQYLESFARSIASTHMLNTRSGEDADSSRTFYIVECELRPMWRHERKNPYLTRMISAGKHQLVAWSSSLPSKYRYRSVSQVAISGHHSYLGSRDLRGSAIMA